MKRRTVRILIQAICGLLAVAACVPAAALADIEPNNSVFAPEGPIAGGQDIAGTLSPGDDDDWYMLYVEGVHQLHLSSTQDAPENCISIRLTDANGRPIASDYTSPPGNTQFFVHAERTAFTFGCAPNASYSFRIDPATAVFPGPERLPIRGTAEPNDTRADASGPLLPGAWYFTELETVNDQDWLRFYVRPGTWDIDVQTVTYRGEGCALALELTNAHGDTQATAGNTRELIAHMTHETRRGAKLFVHSAGIGGEGCVRTATVVQVGPAEAIMSKAEVKAACAKGRKASRRWSKRVAADKRAIRRAGDDASRRLKRKLARDRRKLKAAKRSVGIYCERR